MPPTPNRFTVPVRPQRISYSFARAVRCKLMRRGNSEHFRPGLYRGLRMGSWSNEIFFALNRTFKMKNSTGISPQSKRSSLQTSPEQCGITKAQESEDNMLRLQAEQLQAVAGSERIQPFKAYRHAAIVFILFSAFFLIFRSSQYTAVDGALRCLEVFHRQSLFFHGNNHLLYPVNILFWSEALRLVGIKASTPLEFLTISQSMNGVAAAASLAALYLLTWFATSSIAISWGAALFLGLARAFLLHATNSAEPMLGLFFALAAMLVVFLSLRANRFSTLMLAGIFFALAMATYQSMVLAAPLAGLLCLGWTGNGRSLRNPIFMGISRAIVLVAGTILGLCLIFGWAYWNQGAKSPAQIAHMFFAIGGGPDVYGGFAASKFVNAPVGFISNIFKLAPDDYAGLRHFFATSSSWERVALFLPLFLVLLTLVYAASEVLKNIRQIASGHILLLAASTLTLAITGWPLIYWGPLYDKLWLEPLALLTFLMAVILTIHRRQLQKGSILTLAFIAVIVLEAGTNLPSVIRDHTRATDGLKEASMVASVISTKDAVVVDFDPISSLYYSIWGAEGDAIVMPAYRRVDVAKWLARARSKTSGSGGYIYFLGILDQPEAGWNAFLGQRLGIPYHDFDEFRGSANIVQSFRVKDAVITLRRFGPIQVQ